MDTNKTLSYIDIAGNDLKVTGPGTLKVVNGGTAIGGGGTLWSSSNMIVGATTESGAAYAIEVGTFTFYAESLSGSLVVEGQQGIKSEKLNISYSDAVTITARDGIAINSKDVTVNSNDGHITGTTYGIYSDGYKYAPHAVRLSGVIDIQSNDYGIHTSTNDAALWSDCKSLSISANTAISCDEMHLNRGHYLFNGSTQAVIFDSFDLNYYPESGLQIISPNNGSVSGTTIVDSEGDPAKIVRIYAPITESIDVSVAVPVRGNAPQTTSFSGDIPEHCIVKNAVWYENGTQMANNATFKGGKSYRVELTLETTDNYTFKYNIAGKINGVDANPQLSNNNSTMVLTADMGTLPDEIDLLDLSVDVPVAGATPAKPTTNTDFTSIYAYEWKLNGNTLGYGENFEGGQTYRLVVRATTTKKFADNVVVKINGVTANVLSVDNNAGVLFESYFAIPMGNTYTVTFDANGGSGNMAPVNNVSGDYTLPDCTFTAPSGKHFKAWNVGGNEKAVGATISVTENTTVTAVWEEDIILSQEIDSASATITAPVAGNTPSYVITPADSDKYTVSVNLWYINEGNYDTLLPTDTYVAGKSYALRVTFSAKAGYCFADSASFKINGVSAHKYGSVGDVEVIFAVPAAQPTEYMVSYNANGGSGTMVGDMVEENGKFTLKNCTYIAPEGYQFKAWAIGSVNGEQKQPGEQITITAETYIYAIWEAVEYNVTVTGGTASVGAGTPITKATMGTTVTLTAGAAPTGQMFDKWVVNGVVVDDANSATTTFVMPAGNVTAEATYKNIPVVTYTVSFDANGGTGSMADATGVSGDYVLPVCGFTAPNGKQFKAWSVGGVEKAAGDTITVNANTTVTAIWENIPVVTYTVSFAANGGTGTMADVTGISGEYTLPANGFTAPAGKQFKAWSVGGVEKAVGDKITVTANTTVTAVWEAVEYNVTVTGGTASVGAGTPITKATMGTTVTLTAGAAPTGQMFDKWVVNGVVVADANSATTTFVMPAGNVTAEATYKNIPIVTYTVSFDANGGTGSMADATGVSGDYVLPVCGFTAPNGKQFKAWSVGGVEKAAGDTITVNANTTVTAIWENIPVTYYTVTFDSNGGSAVTAQNIEAGQKATKPADPTKDGYDFKGWTLNGSAYDFNTAVNGNITLVATWEQQQVVPTTYTVSFAANGGTGTMADVTGISGEYTLPENGFTAPDGKQFKAWSVDGNEKAVGDKITVAADTTVKAVWENIPAAPIEYEILDGANSKWTQDSDENLSVRGSGAFSEFVGVKVDGKSVDEKYYTVKEGSTIVTLKAGYLNTLTVGSHTLEIIWTDGSASTAFTVNAKAVVDNDTKSPQTGDNSMMWLWVALLFVSGFGVVATTVIGKKKSSAK